MSKRTLTIILATFIITIGAPVGASQERSATCEGHDKVLSDAAQICKKAPYRCKVSCSGGAEDVVTGYACCCGAACLLPGEKKD